MLESINPETAGWKTRYALHSEKERFPCWCVLIRLELVGPATACLLAWPGETGLPSPAALLPPTSPYVTFNKGTGDTGSFSFHHSWAKMCHIQRDIKQDPRCYKGTLSVLRNIPAFHKFNGLCLYKLDQVRSKSETDKQQMELIEWAESITRDCVFSMREHQQAWCGCEHKHLLCSWEYLHAYEQLM